MILSYILFAGSAFFLIYDDVREQKIPLSGLSLLMVATFLKQFWEPNIEGVWAAGAIACVVLGCQGLFSLAKGKLAMGWGDVILSPCCGLWLYVEELPFFFVVTGLFSLCIGILWRYRWGMRTFPFAPAIIAGLGVVFLIRCFLKMNEI